MARDQTGCCLWRIACCYSRKKLDNVVIVKNTYPDVAALNNVIHYALSKAVWVGGYGVTPEIEAAQMQMQFVKQAFYQTDALQLKHFIISYSHEEAMFIEFEEMLRTAFEAAKLFREYQVVYGLHLDGSHAHVHMVMNTTSFQDGHQYSDGLGGITKVCSMLKKKYPQYPVNLCMTRYYTSEEPFTDADKGKAQVLKSL